MDSDIPRSCDLDELLRECDEGGVADTQATTFPTTSRLLAKSNNRRNEQGRQESLDAVGRRQTYSEATPSSQGHRHHYRCPSWPPHLLPHLRQRGSVSSRSSIWVRTSWRVRQRLSGHIMASTSTSCSKRLRRKLLYPRKRMSCLHLQQSKSRPRSRLYSGLRSTELASSQT